jgi:hypothetical protein
MVYRVLFRAVQYLRGVRPRSFIRRARLVGSRWVGAVPELPPILGMVSYNDIKHTLVV